MGCIDGVYISLKVHFECNVKPGSVWDARRLLAAAAAAPAKR